MVRERRADAQGPVDHHPEGHQSHHQGERVSSTGPYPGEHARHKQRPQHIEEGEVRKQPG